MSRGRNGAAGGANCDAYSMIENARSLQRVAKELEWDWSKSPESDPVLFEGKFLASPILLTLAIEIALKAWLCRERKKDPPCIHDLLELFKNWNLAHKHRCKQRCRGGLGFGRLPTKMDRCLSSCIRTGMRTRTGGTSTKNTGVCFEVPN